MWFSRWRKTPTARRSSALAALALGAAWLVSGVTHAETVTEADVVRRVSDRSADAALARAEVERAEAREKEARLYPNPSLAWSREHVLGDGGGREDVLALSVPVDVSGRRAAETSLARSGTRAARAEAVRARSHAVRHALETFYGAMAAEARAAVARRTRERLAESVRVLTRRAETGDVPGYERVRLELELELAQTELHETESAAEALRVELSILLGSAAPLELRGALDAGGGARPSEPRAGTPSLELERSALHEARAARRSAGTAWIPVLELTGGVKAEATDRTRYGYVAGVMLDLPLFSGGGQLEAAAEAEDRAASARRTALAERARLEIAVATRAFERATAELARFHAATGERIARLERSIEAGYREGTRSLGDLLDAEKARASVERRRIDLAAALRRAELALRAAHGEFER